MVIKSNMILGKVKWILIIYIARYIGALNDYKSLE